MITVESFHKPCGCRSVDRQSYGSKDLLHVDVTDCGKVIKGFGEVERGDFGRIFVLENAANAWLNEHHPDWKNPLACW